MMMISNSQLLMLLLASNALLLAIAAVAVLRFHRQVRRFGAFWNSPTGAALAHRETEATSSVATEHLKLKRRVTELQAVVRTLAEKSRRPDLPVTQTLPIENALRMAKQGASVDELTKNCGLNIGEARLMQKLHGKMRAAADAA